MMGYLNARHRRHVWLTRSIICGQPAVSTNAGFKLQRLGTREFVIDGGGGSRPLAGLRSGRHASPRFTSRCIAERDRNLEALRPLVTTTSLNSWWLWQFTRASRRHVWRETAHGVGFAEGGATSGRFIFGSVAPPVRLGKTLCP